MFFSEDNSRVRWDLKCPEKEEGKGFLEKKPRSHVFFQKGQTDMKRAPLSWLSDNCKFAQYVEDSSPEDEKNDEQQDYIQWMSSNNKIFFPASKNVKVLVPGFYEIGESMSAGLFFKKVALNTEELIHFPETNIDEVVEEIETFWDRESKFREAGLAFKRGILMYGPPGSGKTSAVKMILNNIVKRGGVVIKFENPNTFSAGMKTMREIQADTPVVCLMEDLDSILEWNSESRVINVIDGMEGFDKIVFLATTNYPEKLGSRIMNRPSRFDKRIFIGMPNAESRRIYLKAKLEGKDAPGGIDKWVEDSDGFSIAHLKEMVVAVTILGKEYDETVRRLKSMADKVDSKEWDNFGEGDAFAQSVDEGLKAIAADAKGLKTARKPKERDKLKGGLGDESDVSEFDPEQLGKGVRVEKEHTTDTGLATEIAKDHLVEDPKYYDGLEEMEEKSMTRKDRKAWVKAYCKFAKEDDASLKIERTPSGWNTPELPGQYFKSANGLMTALAELISPKRATYASLDELAKEYNEWLTSQGLPPESADELLHREDISSEQRAYLESFVSKWDLAESQEEENPLGEGPMGRIYDLNKIGPGMTPEEDEELRRLLRQHGRPKYMARNERTKRYSKTVGKEQAEETHETFEERNSEHPTKECIERMKKEKSIDDPGAFCAKIRDKAEGDTDWRGEDDEKKHKKS